MSAYEAQKALEEKLDLIKEDKETVKTNNNSEIPIFKREIQNGIYEITEQYNPEGIKINKNTSNKKKNVECFSLNDFLSKKKENSDLKITENNGNDNSKSVKKESLFKQRMKLKKQQNK